MTSVPRVSWLPNSNRPSLLVLAWASCLDLSLDTNRGRCWNACVAQHSEVQQHGGGHLRSVDLEHVLLLFHDVQRPLKRRAIRFVTVHLDMMMLLKSGSCAYASLNIRRRDTARGTELISGAERRFVDS